MNIFYFKFAFKYLKRQRNITFVSILSLTLGIAVSSSMLSFCRFEFSFDDFQTKKDNIYRLVGLMDMQGSYYWEFATTDNAYGPAMKDAFKEVLGYCRLVTYESERDVIGNNNNIDRKQFREKMVYFVEGNFFQFFNYPLLKGDPKHVLEEPNTAVISEDLSKKYFGEEDPIGKSLLISTNGESINCTITGVFKNMPINSNLQLNLMISFESLRKSFPQVDNSWNYGISYTYLKLLAGTNIKELERMTYKLYLEKSGYIPPPELRIAVRLEPFSNIHLNSFLQWEHEKKGNRQNTLFLLFLSIAIILISFTNHLNLSTSNLIERTKEFSTKRLLGANNLNIVKQFTTEAFIINLLSGICALILMNLARYYINSITDVNFPNSFWYSLDKWIMILITVIAGTIFTGLLPSMVFARKFRNSPQFKINLIAKNRFRKSIIVLQYAATMIFMLGTIIVYMQVTYMKKKELCINTEKILVIKSPTGINNQYSGLEKFKDRVQSITQIKSCTGSSDIPGNYIWMSWLIDRRDLHPLLQCVIDGIRIDEDFVKTYQLNIIAGKDFLPNSKGRDILINEEALRLLQFKTAEEAIDKIVYFPEFNNNDPYRIIGVIKNYHQQSPEKRFLPLFLICNENFYHAFKYYSLKIDTNDPSILIHQLKNVWSDLYPNSSFEYFFLNDYYQSQYTSSIQFGRLFAVLSFFAIILTISGVVGLSILTAQKRMKEIGIRKVNGASVSSIIILLSKRIVVYGATGCILAIPLMYYFMNKWLNNYAYRITINWIIVSIALISLLAISVITISWLSWKLAYKNPVEALRNE